MSEESNQNDKKVISPFWTTASITALIIILINNFIPESGDIKLATSIAPFASSVIAYILQYLFAMFLFSPQDFAINKRLKRDEKALIKHLKTAIKSPELYSEEEIIEYKKDLQDTRKERAQIGRNSL